MASLDIYSQLVSLDGAPLGQTQDARVLENVMHLNDAHDIFFFFLPFRSLLCKNKSMFKYTQ